MIGKVDILTDKSEVSINPNKRVNWVDTLRGIAIVAVVADHAFYLFVQFRSDFIWKSMYFSVPWFVFLAGYTSTISILKHGWRMPASVILYWLRKWTIPAWYVAAAMFIYWYDNRSNFILTQFWDKLLLFSVEPTYYFINLILQLYLFFPLLISIILPLKNRYMHLALVVLVYFFSEYYLMHTSAPWPFAPAGKILGGLYLTVYVSGIIFALENLFASKLVIILATVIFTIYEIIFIQTSGSFIGIVPNIPSIMWSVGLLILVAGIIMHLKLKIFDMILGFFGKQSLTIYLWHFFILRQFFTWPKNTIEFIGVIFTALFIGSLVQPIMNLFNPVKYLRKNSTVAI